MARAGWKPTPEQAAEVRRGNAAGETLTSIAKAIGVSKPAISVWASEQDPPLSWARSPQMALAAQTRSARAAELRAARELRYSELADFYLDQLEAPCVATFGGVEYLLSKPLPSDRRAFAQMSLSFHNASQEIADRRASAGLGLAKSLLGDLAAAMGVDTSLFAGDDDQA